jgi:hypothetical protein
MKGMLATEFTKFFQLELVLLNLFVPCARVIPLLTFGALKRYDFSHSLSILFALRYFCAGSILTP